MGSDRRGHQGNKLPTKIGSQFSNQQSQTCGGKEAVEAEEAASQKKLGELLKSPPPTTETQEQRESRELRERVQAALKAAEEE